MRKERQREERRKKMEEEDLKGKRKVEDVDDGEDKVPPPAKVHCCELQIQSGLTVSCSE